MFAYLLVLFLEYKFQKIFKASLGKEKVTEIKELVQRIVDHAGEMRLVPNGPN